MFCDIYGNKCFDEAMENVSSDNKCDCPLECEFINYSFTIVSTPLDSKEYCPKKLGTKDFLMRPFYENKYPPQLIRKLMKAKYNVSNDAMEYCKSNLQYRAVVTFQLATDSMSVTVMSQRLTFYDKMSAFGKN